MEERRKGLRQRIRWMITGLLVLFLSLGTMATAMADEPDTEEVSSITRQVSQEIYSPFCPGKTLAMCPSENASYARQDIQTMAEGGMNAEEIKAELVEEYGDGYELVEPRKRDQMTLLGGLVGGLLTAIFVVGYLARRLKGEDDEESGDAELNGDPGSDDQLYLDELRAEVRD